MEEERIAMAAAEHILEKMWSYAVLDASDKDNYLTTAKIGKIQSSPNAHISLKFPGAKIANPSCLIPWGQAMETR